MALGTYEYLPFSIPGCKTQWLTLSHAYLPDILILLRVERQFYEYLLQLLVAVVDDELFEAVALKHLKAVYIQHTHHFPFHFAVGLVGKERKGWEVMGMERDR
jgi:hypothetical protein